jgi:hypothetical protein
MAREWLSCGPTFLSNPKQGCRKRPSGGIHRATHAPTPRGTVNASLLLAKAFFLNHLEKIIFTLDLFLLSDTLCSGRWGGYFSAGFTMTNGHNNVWHNPQTGVSPFKVFLSIRFRTLCPQWSPLAHLISITSALFPIQWRGECPSRLRPATHRSRPTPSPFFSNDSCVFCIPDGLTGRTAPFFHPNLPYFIFNNLQPWQFASPLLPNVCNSGVGV